MSMEIELKLAVAAGDVERLRRHPVLAASIAPPVTGELETIYFDTADLELQRQRAALRVRRAADGWIQTLKAGGGAENGVHSRHEWESPVPSPGLDLPALQALAGEDSPWGRLLGQGGLKERLSPVFVTRFARTVWMIALPGGDLIEVALDLGEVTLGGAKPAAGIPICEVELELKAGDPACLTRFAQLLMADLSLVPDNVSKAERGYRLAALATAQDGRQDGRQIAPNDPNRVTTRDETQQGEN